jgi:hypothetical protein
LINDSHICATIDIASTNVLIYGAIRLFDDCVTDNAPVAVRSPAACQRLYSDIPVMFIAISRIIFIILKSFNPHLSSLEITSLDDPASIQSVAQGSQDSSCVSFMRRFLTATNVGVAIDLAQSK